MSESVVVSLLSAPWESDPDVERETILTLDRLTREWDESHTVEDAWDSTIWQEREEMQKAKRRIIDHVVGRTDPLRPPSP